MSDGDTGHGTIQTFTGRYVAPYDLYPADVDVRDVAHALSNICRFQGHVREFYSVAQHSVLCSYLVPAGKEMAALLHDSPETYACDLAGPLKRDTQIGALYKAVEDRIAAAVERAFGLDAGALSDRDVKGADWAILQVEGRQLMPGNGWARTDILADMVIVPWAPTVAEVNFLDRWEQLHGER